MVPTARVEGVVLDSEGRPAVGAQVSVLPKNVTIDLFLAMPRATMSGGRFTAPGIAPGTYVVTARGRGGPAGRGAPPPPSLWATREITVAGQDLTNLELRLEPGIAIAGRLAFDSATNQSPANIATGFRASLIGWRADPAATTVSISVPSATVDAEGKFQFASVVPGTYGVSAYGGAIVPEQGPAWVMKSVTANGRDITDRPLEIRPREAPPDIVITLTDKVSEVSGVLYDAAGRPASGLSIVLFPTSRDLWTQNSRRIRPVTPASDGRFRLAGLPAGEYYMAAVTEYEYTDLTDASFLEQLAANAFKISIAEGEKKVQDIRMGGS
jgi:hypothetical protein